MTHRLLVTIFLMFFCAISFASENETLRLATTTSTESSGLLAVLLPPFEKAQLCRVHVISVGTGKAIKLGESGDVDVILVHARELEEKFMARGFGINRRDVMYNDFVVLGPKNDPAGIAGTKDVTAAFRAIANAKVPFISRGDESGTHARERKLWQAANMTPRGAPWYREAGSGMGAVITMTAELQGYTLSDRGTYLAYKDRANLEILVAGDDRLFNPYGVIQVNPARHPHVNAELARRFIEYLISPEARKIITGFQKNGEQLFFVTAE